MERTSSDIYGEMHTKIRKAGMSISLWNAIDGVIQHAHPCGMVGDKELEKNLALLEEQMHLIVGKNLVEALQKAKKAEEEEWEIKTQD